MAKNILNKLLDKRTTQLREKAKTKTLTAATPTVDDPTLQTWIKEISSTVKDIASSSVRRSDLVRANIATIANGELQNALSPPEEVNLTVPAAVLNLTASGAYSSNTLTWETRPSKFFGQNNIYRSDVDDFGTATHIGSTLGDVYTDYVGNNIKAYYWVRTISKFGVEGELSPSVYAETAIDVGYVLQQLEGHITLSQLDQILRGEISSISDIANGLQEEARLRVLELAALADQLRQESIDKAQEIQDRIDGVNNQIQQQIVGLNDGITTEVNSRLDAEQQIINALEAYKLSNDNAVGAVINKVDIATSTNEVQALAISGLQANFETVSEELSVKADISNLTLAENKIAEVEGRVIATTENITALGTRMDTVEGAVSTKLEASALNDYYTRTETDDKATTIAAGEVSKYDASLVIGGTNLVLNTSEEKDGYFWLFVEPLTEVLHPGIYTISYDLVNINDTPSDGSGVGFRDPIANTHKYVWYPDEVTGHKTKTLHLDSYGFTHFAIYTNVAAKIKNVKLERGSKATSWSPAPQEIKNALYFNANAIQATNAEVARINGEVVATANSLIGLRSDVDTASANLSANYFTKAETNNAIAGKVEEFSSSLEVGGVNTYNHLAPQLSNYGGIHIEVNHVETPNGLYLIGNQSYINTLRFEGVITSIGWWTVSFYIRGVQNVNVGFMLDICDTVPAVRVQSTADNTWKRVTHTAYVDRVDAVYSFVDFADVDWAYVLIKDIKIEKGNVATAWTPHPKLLEDSVANIKNTYVTESKLNSSIAAQSTEITSKLSRITEDNLLHNADFRSGSLKGWYTGNYLDSFNIIHIDSSHFLASYGIQAGFSKTVAIHSSGVSSGYVEIAQQVTVKENRRYQLSCYAATHRCSGQVFCYFYRADGSLISNSPIWEPQQIVNPDEALGGSHLYDYKRIYQNVTTPAGTAVLAIVIRRNGGNDAYMFVTRAQVVEIFDENLVEWQSSSVQNDATIKETTQSINGIEAIKTVTIDNNGVMSGYGLISELKNGQVTSSFGVNADTFYIGSPNNNKKPFAVFGSSGVINGVTVPAGTYIDTAYIPNGTITNAKIGDLSADKITAGNIAADRMKANIVAAASGQFTSLSSISATIGVLRTATSGARTEIKDNLIEVYDANNRLRVRMGVW